MTTRNYPQEIEEQSNSHAAITKLVTEAKARMEEVTDAITHGVLTETDRDTGKPAFTNDKARELAIRERQRASGEYQRLAEMVMHLELDRAAASARLERLRGEFSLLKIERRERIAAIDAAIN